MIVKSIMIMLAPRNNQAKLRIMMISDLPRAPDKATLAAAFAPTTPHRPNHAGLRTTERQGTRQTMWTSEFGWQQQLWVWTLIEIGKQHTTSNYYSSLPERGDNQLCWPTRLTVDVN